MSYRESQIKPSYLEPAHLEPGYATSLRPPGDGECRFCGSAPAAHTAFQSFLTVAVFYRLSTLRGWMCRLCGLAVFRSQTSRTLVGCWWGPGVIATPIILIANRLRLRRVLRLDPPRPIPGVAASVPTAMDPGAPVLARPSGIFALVMLAMVSGTLLVVAVDSLV